ncbi:MAG: hypothetical protein HZA95_02275 [Candidatus Vogelbacteria bacterium]|nr:hypothetical protein [Candidatus Vogelbacteria bacterium]
MDASGVPLLRSVLDNIVNPIIGLLIAIAFVWFLWGVVEFVKGSDNANKVEGAKNKMLWGIVGLFIMVSAIGIVRVICTTIGSC